MSVFNTIFGSAKHDKAIDGLFGSAAPVDRTRLVRERTVPDSRPQNVSPEDITQTQTSSPQDDNLPQTQSQPRKKSTRDENFDLEARYFDKLLKEDKPDVQPVPSVEESSDDSDSEETKPAKRAKVVDLKETELEKAEKTVFVGNVPISVVTSKPTYKRFKHLFANVGPVQSIRFRSISFDQALPRKIAFAQKSFHANRQNINSYVVFETKEASLKAVDLLNATVFDQFHLKVDHVTHPTAKDNKRTVFVGNLDFDEQEETLWKYFNAHTANDVESVRIVRDAKTNLGKGFALVQFNDSLSVNKVLMLHDKPIGGGSKRKLRISRAKNHAKPSELSPNHIDNQKQNKNKKGLRSLNDKQKTTLGRVKVLGKADKATAGDVKMVMEGERAHKRGLLKNGQLKVKKPRHKKPRIRDRSTRFKEQLKAGAGGTK